MEAVAAALETTVEYLQYGVSEEELVQFGGPEQLRESVAAKREEIKEILQLTDLLKDALTLEGVHVGYAFDTLSTPEQKEAVIALLRAFGNWELKGDQWDILKKFPSESKLK